MTTLGNTSSHEEKGRARRTLAAGISGALWCALGLVLLPFAVGPDWDIQGLSLIAIYGALLIPLLCIAFRDRDGFFTALGIFAITLLSIYIAGDEARDVETLKYRGETVHAIANSVEYMETSNRTYDSWFYTLTTEDGTSVPGPRMELTSPGLQKGDKVTVTADPEGSVAPRLPKYVDSLLWARYIAIALFCCLAGILYLTIREYRRQIGKTSETSRQAMRQKQPKPDEWL